MKRRFTLNHRHLFVVGWVYYLLVPLLIGVLGGFDTVDSVGVLGRYFDPQSPSWPYLVAYALMAPLAYGLGSLWAPLRATVRRKAFDAPHRSGAWILLPVYGLMVAIFAVQARSLLGAGYMGGFDVSLLGPLATVHMLILYQYLYERSCGRRVATAFALLLGLNSVLLLSMGGRLYVVSALIAIYFRWWNWAAPSRATQLRSLALIVCVPAALVGIGMWRVGETNYTLVGFYLLSESTFTSISSFTLFTGGQWSGLLDMPNEFIAAFANVIPSQLWLGKADWLEAVAAANQNFETPFGAVSIIASTVGNFGFVGGLVFFLAVGIYMTAVGRTRGDAARESHYCYLVGLLPFMFFRDPFQVQVKVVMTGFVLYWLTVLLRHRRGAAPVGIEPTAHAGRPRPLTAA